MNFSFHPTNHSRRRVMKLALVSLVSLPVALPFGAMAQAVFPDKPVRVVVPFAPGNTLDTALRQVAEVFKVNTGQTLVVDAKPGGSGIIAAQHVMQAAPDGYTLLLANTSMFTINPHTFAKLPYDPVKDFKPVTNGGCYQRHSDTGQSLPANCGHHDRVYCATRWRSGATPVSMVALRRGAVESSHRLGFVQWL